jgi:NAD(P)-dependent dehydrogenase (short-subunit alcohol dehydrogenase family)
MLVPMSPPGADSPATRVALVTGSARGLGFASARRLAARGDRVHVVWRSSEERAAQLEEEFPGRVHRADLVSEEGAAELVERVLAVDGRLDVVVHAVGGYASGPLAGCDAGTLRDLWESNVLSAFHLASAVRPHLRERGGRLVFFGTAGLAGLGARREAAAYASAKSALLVLARSLAVEEAPHGVTVNVVSPGVVPHDGAHPDTLDPALLARIPAGRPGTPEEVAEAVCWLTSEEARHTTGADVPVTGGWLI